MKKNILETSVREQTKMTTTQLDTYVHNQINLVIDAINRDLNVINTQKRMLDQLDL